MKPLLQLNLIFRDLNMNTNEPNDSNYFDAINNINPYKGTLYLSLNIIFFFENFYTIFFKKKY